MRNKAIEHAYAHFDSGHFKSWLTKLVARPTESPVSGAPLRQYLQEELSPRLQGLGFTTRIAENPVAPQAPFLIASRHEDEKLPTVLSYGHGDVVQGQPDRWSEGLSPWSLQVHDDRWYGRGTADNKGQHAINISALEAVMKARGGQLGFNMKLLYETGEEIASPGLRELCKAERQALSADLFLASDGPRVDAAYPTVFLGSRGAFQFELHVTPRSVGYHSGNWGGILCNPAFILSHALASLVDQYGRISVKGLRPPPISDHSRALLARLPARNEDESALIDEAWGEPGLTSSEKLLAWNALEVLAMKSGDPDRPVNAIPPSAFAICQMRFVQGSDQSNFEKCLNEHFRSIGLENVEVRVTLALPASSLEIEDPWVGFVTDSLRSTVGDSVRLLPNFAATLPNDAFALILGMPTIWIPHSYPSCSQHAPNEHLLGSVARQALGMMAGLFFDIGERGQGVAAASRSYRGRVDLATI